jgi:uncharacterized protein
MKGVGRHTIWALATVLALAGCGSPTKPASSASPTPSPTSVALPGGWVEDEVTFQDEGGLIIHGTYRHRADAAPGPAAVLISESGNTDRNGDNAVAGPVGNMRQLAEYLAGKGIATLRYDKVGTGKTGIGPYALHPKDVGSAVYTLGARAAAAFLAAQSRTDKSRISSYGLGEGTVHALQLGAAPAPGGPAIHSLGLFQPLPGRYLDIITGRVRLSVAADVKASAKTQQQADDVLNAWLAAVDQIRTKGTVPDKLPEGLGAIVNAGNVKAVIESDAIDPVALAAKLPAGTPVLLTCSDSDSQANCPAEQPLIDALGHAALTVVQLKGVNHVLRDDPTDNVAKYSKQDPLSPQLLTALDGFVGK